MSPCIVGKQFPCTLDTYSVLVAFEYPMLHTKFQGHRLFGSREEDFLKVFTIYWHGGHFGHVTWTI